MKTLADDAQAFLANPIKFMGLPKQILKNSESSFLNLKMNLRKAKRFTLTDEFVKSVVEAASVQSDEMLERCQIANLPFESIWIEFDQNTRVDHQWSIGTSVEPRLQDLGRVGYLLRRDNPTDPENWTSFEFGQITNETASTIMLNSNVQHFSHKESFSLEKVKEWDLSQLEFIASGWGYTPAYLDKNRGDIITLLSYGRTGVDPIYIPSLIKNSPDKLEDIMSFVIKNGFETRGDLRFLVTLLSMINAIPEITYSYEKHEGRFTSHMKSFDFLDTNIVSLKLGRKSIKNYLKARTREHIRKFRRHDVRGHYRTYHRGTPDEFKIFVDKYWRGDASLGFVKKEYKLIDEKDQI